MARRSFTSFAVVALVVTLVTIAAAVPATPVQAERSSHGVEIAALMREVASIQSPLAVGDLYERLNNLYLALKKELLAQRASWKGQAKTLVEAVNALQAKVTKKAAFVSSLEKRINETVAKVEKAKARVQPIQQNVDWLTGNATAVRAEIQKGDDARAAELKLFEKRIGDSKFVQSAITAVISKLDEGLKLDAKANRFPDTLSLLELEADEEAPATEVDTDAEERAVAEEQTNEVMESAAAQQPTDPMMMRFMDAVLGMSKKVTDAKALRRGLQRLHDQVGDYVADLKASEEEAYLAWDGVRRTLVADRNKLLEQRWDARAHLKALLHHVEVRTDKLAELRENRASLPAIVDNLVAQIATRRKQYTDLENAFKAEVTELRNELSTVRAMRSLVKKAMDDAMTAKF